MTKEAFAAMLNGREYGSEMSPAECVIAKRAGLIVIFGASDDLIEFQGVIDAEGDCYGGGEFKIDRGGLLRSRSEIDDGDDEELKSYFKREPRAARIKAIWNKEGYSWTYEITCRHGALPITVAEFDILEDGEKYCRGMVIDAKDLPSL